MTRPGRMTRRRGLILGLVALMAGGGLVAWLRYDPWPIRAVIPTPDGPDQSWVAADGRSILVPTSDREGAVAWDLTTGRPGRLPVDPTIRWVATTPDGRDCLGYRSVAGPAFTGEIVRVDAASGAIRLRLPTTISSADGLDLALADGGRTLRALDQDGHGRYSTLVTWDVATGWATAMSLKRSFGGWMLAYSGVAGSVACTDAAGDGIQIWDVAAHPPNGERLDAPRPFGSADSALFTPDGRTLIVAHEDGLADFWDVPARRLVRTTRLHHGELDPKTWRIAPDGRTLLAAVAETVPAPSRLDWLRARVEPLAPAWFQPTRESVVIDLVTGRRLAHLRSRTEQLTDFSPDGRWVMGIREDAITLRAAPIPPPSP